MTGLELWIAAAGAACFGIVIGWVTYRTLYKKTETDIGDIAAVIAAVGGGAVTSLFKGGIIFGLYCIGLFIGFFAFFIVMNGPKPPISFLEGPKTQ
jgi:hypothetical protein